jgi:hypothetical protein
MRVRATTRIALALWAASMLAPAIALCAGSAPRDGERRDSVTRLQALINGGRVKLHHDEQFGYLPAVLKALRVPVSSQMLVFAKDSVQKDIISPSNPRALYMSDDTYVGFVPGGKSVEVVANDPQEGPIYYVLLQEQVVRPTFFRTVAVCMSCHAGKRPDQLAQHVMRSLFVDSEGTPLPGAPVYDTTDRSPLAQRWGGWYVTGTCGGRMHMGNRFAALKDGRPVLEAGGAQTPENLNGRLDTSMYLAPGSDIVALMVLGHQVPVQNLIANIGWDLRGAGGNAITRPRIRDLCEPLVLALLFSGEARLAAPVHGLSGYAQEFSARGPFDHRGRSLRQFDLKTRLFRYRCSYLIYSAAFDALPDPAKNYVYDRLWAVLTGRDRSRPFAHLSAADRSAIRHILIDTKPEFAARRPRLTPG